MDGNNDNDDISALLTLQICLKVDNNPSRHGLTGYIDHVKHVL